MVHAFRDVTFLAALAASVTIHASLLAALGGVDGAPQSWNAVTSEPVPRLLAVALVKPESPLLRIPEPTPIEAATLPSPPSPEEPPAPAPPATPASVTGAANPLDRAGLYKPHIDVSDQVPRARFGDALDHDTLADFHVEVDRAIVLPDRIDVAYPPAALAAGREATVLAWAVIDAKGDVEETHIVEGPDEFADAAKSALAATKFIPAHNKGHDVRFYIALEFVFRIDAATGSVAAGAATSAER